MKRTLVFLSLAAVVLVASFVLWKQHHEKRHAIERESGLEVQSRLATVDKVGSSAFESADKRKSDALTAFEAKDPIRTAQIRRALEIAREINQQSSGGPSPRDDSRRSSSRLSESERRAQIMATVAAALQATNQRSYARFFELHDMSGATQQATLNLVSNLQSAFANEASSLGQFTLAQIADQQAHSFKEMQSGAVDLLGQDLGAQFLAYQQSLPLRRIANSVATSSAQSGEPISPETVDELTDILQIGRVNISGSNEQVSQFAYVNLTVNDATAIGAATAILTPKQVELLQQALANRYHVSNRSVFRSGPL